MRLKVVTIQVVFAISILAAASSFFLQYQSRVVADRVFGNMTYLTNSPYVSVPKEVALVNGQYEWAYVSEDDVYVSYDLQYGGCTVYGDFNHDGLKDAAAIIIENSGGNADWYHLAFLINDGKQFVHKNSGVLDDRAVVNWVREKNGKVIVDLFVHQDGDCMAGPTHHVQRTFEYKEGNSLWLEGEQNSAKSFLDPAIYFLKDPTSWMYIFERWKI